MSDFTKDLNEVQKQAVVYNDGPQLVIAGAGSGKTRVLTYKIAYLLQQGVHPSEILALTFTNKAAREMNERICELVENGITRYLWSGTFHSIFAKILRINAQYIGYRSDYTIYDTSDSKSLIKSIVKELMLDDKVYKPQDVASKISSAKSRLILPEQYARDAEISRRDQNCGMRRMAEIYAIYQKRCQMSNAMDFDDLLLNTFLLFRNHEQVRQHYATQFRHILVDEYQDTNYVQYMILSQITQPESSICVVGDDAQSIYSFRGANIDNILNFQKHYPTAVVTKLECNYRSTSNIVEAANSIIKNNRRQIPKNVYSLQGEGSPLCLHITYSEKDESLKVASEIRRILRREAISYNDIALLYRTNAQSRSFEEAFRQNSIPYRIYGGLSFYQRKEIKDVIAYFRLIVNPNDEEALKRIINYPARGIGQTTINKLQALATDSEQPLWTVATHISDYAENFSKATQAKVLKFVSMISAFANKAKATSAYALADEVIRQSGIIADLQNSNDETSQAQLENLEELLNSIRSYEEEVIEEEGRTQILLTDFLSQVSLLTDRDAPDDSEPKVTLMTIHAAKGLEYHTVFITGLEEGIFPTSSVEYSPRELEEERRLFYVAVTRAKRNCILTHARSRFRWGKTENFMLSRFVQEIDDRYIEGTPRIGTPRFSATTTSTTRPSSAPSQRTTSLAPTSQRTASLKPLTHLPSATPSSSVAPSPGNLSVGSMVEHDRFGLGVVVAMDGAGDNAKATVDFTNAGCKTLLLRFAKIKLL